jgi:hypothetical protein
MLLISQDTTRAPGRGYEVNFRGAVIKSQAGTLFSDMHESDDIIKVA